MQNQVNTYNQFNNLFTVDNYLFMADNDYEHVPLPII